MPGAVPRLLSAAATLLLALLLHAQETRTIDGRMFMVHVVEAGQTLYAISRAHAVPVDELLAANPAATEGLSIGQEVLVPQDAVSRREARRAPELRGGELLHTVARRETLFGIARHYRSDVNMLLERNPGALEGLNTGDVLVIPVAEMAVKESAVNVVAVDDGSIMHEVLPGETLFSLGQRYGVEVDAITAANGGLPEGLKAGMPIRIPADPIQVEAEEPDAALPPPDRRDRYEVAVLLPFSLERNDSLVAASSEPNTMHVTTRVAAQFYAGVQIALDELKENGLAADLVVTVADVGETAAEWAVKLNEASLLGKDLYIGPFHREAVERLARVAVGAHIVNPAAQSNKMVLGHPNVSKVKAAPHDLARFMARYVAATHAADNIILVKPDIHVEREIRGQVHRTLDAALMHQPARMRDSALVVHAGRRDPGQLLSRLLEGRKNVIVVPSEDVEFVTQLVRTLRGQAENHDIVVFGLESWRDMNTIAVDDLDRLNLHVAVNGYMDHRDPRVQEFVKAFRERFHAEPQEYAFLGHDVALYYLTALVQEGRGFVHRLGAVRPELLYLDMGLRQTGPESGFLNEQGVVIAYRDMGIHRVH